MQQLLTDLDLLKEELFPLARRAAMLYSILRSLQSLRNEYQFSLKFFVLLFDEAVGGELPPEFMEEEEEVSCLKSPLLYTWYLPFQLCGFVGILR